VSTLTEFVILTGDSVSARPVIDHRLRSAARTGGLPAGIPAAVLTKPRAHDN
jgi:hypothetical protein